ncbi:unnamed protein product, partial [Mesorhabditis belari]|uniref:Uncharacterized protein n=1 Tax=Mesorhabditis belari TaxID=2138241 RepID=A0AAF3FM37_9BILA
MVSTCASQHLTKDDAELSTIRMKIDGRNVSLPEIVEALRLKKVLENTIKSQPEKEKPIQRRKQKWRPSFRQTRWTVLVMMWSVSILYFTILWHRDSFCHRLVTKKEL